MSIGERTSRAANICMIAAALLVVPQMVRPAAAHGNAGAAPESWQDQDAQDREQEKRDREQEKLDREQEKRDREQERKEREQEKKDQAQEKLDRMQELYDDGREDLDDDKYQPAEQKFNELAQLGGPQTDAALYRAKRAGGNQVASGPGLLVRLQSAPDIERVPML